jgi:hypothetical protein
MLKTTSTIGPQVFERLEAAAHDQSRVAGLTHRHYRYPARFSPAFARACIEAFSSPGDRVLDPYMGGGTTVIEAMVLGRRAYGIDLNSLAVFIAGTKVAVLSQPERAAVTRWAVRTVPALRMSRPASATDGRRPRNMSLPAVRAIRKTIAQCLESAEAELPSRKSFRFAQGVMLNVGQWALNGKLRTPSAGAFRERVTEAALEMLGGVEQLKCALRERGELVHRPVLMSGDAGRVAPRMLKKAGAPIDLVVTSPPYPGVHLLYHRWQVDGRKESDAPYWIARCEDGAGAAYYNFADRTEYGEARYFERALQCFTGVRRVMRHGAVLAQLVAFARPNEQLTAYLKMLRNAGFSDLTGEHRERVWRSVPGRSWHANSKGGTPASREVFLLHRAD